jgi:hypothetical protein
MRYEYDVLPVSPESGYVALETPVAISEKLEQPAPEQRSTLYEVAPLAADHDTVCEVAVTLENVGVPGVPGADELLMVIVVPAVSEPEAVSVLV